MENKLNLDTEFILVSEGGDFKRVNIPSWSHISIKNTRHRHRVQQV